MELQFLRRVTNKEKAFFTRQLATMLDAGLPLTRAINIIQGQTKNKYFSAILSDIYNHLEEGYPFSQCLARYPNVFTEVYISVVKAGEASGKLEGVLKELSSNLEEQNRLMNAVYNAMLYPAFVVVAMILVGFYVISNIIPQLRELFTESNVELPLITKMLLSFSDFFNKFWYLVVLLIVGVILVLRLYFKTPAGRLFWSSLQLRLPLFKPIFEGLHMNQFCRTFGMLTKSGVPIMDTVKIVAHTINNTLYQESMVEVGHQLELGVPMSVPISKNPYFPPLVSQMILVGEQTGRMDEIFLNLAAYYENETSSKIKGVSSLIEPILIIIVGVGVAFMVFAVLVPIYEVSQVVG